MDLGLSKRHLGKMDVDARVLADVAVRYNKTEVHAVMSDAQSRKKVLSLVERLMSKAAGTLVEKPPEGAIDVEAVPVEPTVGEGALDASLEAEVEGNLLAEDEEDPLAAPIDADAISESSDEDEQE
jgi:hypothetical protein